MACNAFRQSMEEYLEGSLPGAQRTSLEAHLQTCSSCQQTLAQAQKLGGSISGMMGRTTGILALRPDIEANILSAANSDMHLDPHGKMMKLFEKMSFRERFSRMLHGLKQPKESGEYKWAALQLRRMISPISAVVVPSLALLLMVALAGMAPRRQQVVNVRIVEDQHIPELEEPIDIPEPEIQPPDPEHIVEPMDNFIPSTSKTAVGPDVDFSPQPAQFDSVAIIRSPVVMRGIFGSRSPGARGSMLGRFGGGGHTEGAVLRALRWLKKHQEEDGSWTLMSGGGTAEMRHTRAPAGSPVGITGLGLLAFLAHGETPASPEFGRTVEGAMRYLQETMDSGGNFPRNTVDGRKNYSQIIAAYALSEAYGMTRIPTLGRSAETAIRAVIGRQKANGGFDYDRENAPDRLDISVTAWAAQAFKAAQMANLNIPELDRVMERTIEAMKLCYRPRGGYGAFSYRASGGVPDNRWWGLTGAAVLGLQLMGQSQMEETRQGMQWLVHNTDFNWENPSRNLNGNPIYNWYYITQAMFHEGGETWRNWNKQFSHSLVKNQTVVPNAIADLSGKMVDIGYWQPAADSEWSQSFSYNTTLCALQLMVYYRYLPTFQTPEQIAAEAAANNEPPPRVVEARDLDIDIQL